MDKEPQNCPHTANGMIQQGRRFNFSAASTSKMADCYFLSTEVCGIVCHVVLGIQYFSGLSSAQCLSNMCPHPEQTLREMPDIEPSLVRDCYKGDTEIVIMCNRGFRLTDHSYTATCNAETGEFVADRFCRIDILTLFIAIFIMLVILFGFLLVTFLVRNMYKTRTHDLQNAPLNEPVVRAVYKARGQAEPVAELCFASRNMACQTEPVRVHQIYANALTRGEESRVYENLPVV